MNYEISGFQSRLLAVAKKIKAFVAKAPKREAEARQIIKTAPGVGIVTAEVVLSELGDASRFPNAKKVCAYAGLVPAAVSLCGGTKQRRRRLGSPSVGRDQGNRRCR